MYKIAILGCENSHADAFIQLIKAGNYPDVEVVGVYTDDPEAIERMKGYGVYIATAFDEFVGKVDGIMVTARHGANHLKYARPYISSGIPMFIDKPATASTSEAVEMMKLFKENGVRISGGSSCIHCEEVKELKSKAADGEHGRVLGGFLRAPISLVNAYGNIWFYSQHLVQIMQEIYGYYPESVSCHKCGNCLNVVFGYGEFDVFATYVDGEYTYHVDLSTEGGMFPRDVKVVPEVIYPPELAAFYNVLIGGEQEQSYADFIAPVFVIDAIIRSYESGERVKIEYPSEEL
ncbi:MAG: Gfo/Idh/MocA family oxidoreductase [Clostridia bacterium]|nr:Gfo/Idh/MocA family oxidoreductase [Clostridia bacterium]MBQ8371752.1 Gfo/Idh/MocA family oxidoreductase [Clostridia bacterium]